MYKCSLYIPLCAVHCWKGCKLLKNKCFYKNYLKVTKQFQKFKLYQMLVCIFFTQRFWCWTGIYSVVFRNLSGGADYIFLFFLERLITRGAQKNWETKNLTDPGGGGRGVQSIPEYASGPKKKFLKNKNPILNKLPTL